MIFTFSASNTSLHPPLGRGRKDWASGTWFEVFPWETNILIWQSISGRKGWEQQIWPEWVGSKCDLSICCIRSRATDHKVAWSIPVLVVSNPAYIPIYAICTPHSDIFQSRERDQNCFVAAQCIPAYDITTTRTIKVHLRSVFGVALLPSHWALPQGVH